MQWIRVGTLNEARLEFGTESLWGGRAEKPEGMTFVW